MVAALAALVTSGDLAEVQAISSPVRELMERGRIKTPSAWVGTVERRFLDGSGSPTPEYDAKVEIEVTVLSRHRRSLAARVKGVGTDAGVMDLADLVHQALDANALGLTGDPAIVPLLPVSDRISHPAPGLAAATMSFMTRMTYRT